MRRGSTGRLLTQIGAAALMTATMIALAGCAPEEPPEPEVLTITSAGARYLDAVCPVNATWDEADVVIDQLRLAVSRGEGDAELFVSAMTEVAESSRAAAESLGSDEVTWPDGSEDEIAGVRDELLRDAEQAEEIRDLPPDEAAAYAWDAGTSAEAAAAAREALGLPEDAEVACAEHAAVQ